VFGFLVVCNFDIGTWQHISIDLTTILGVDEPIPYCDLLCDKTDIFPNPRLELQFGGKNEGREPEVIDVDEFIGIKSYKAKGKRLSIYEISQINELEPTIVDEEIEEPEEEPKSTDIVIPDIEDLLFGTDKPGDNEEPPNQMTLEF